MTGILARDGRLAINKSIVVASTLFWLRAGPDMTEKFVTANLGRVIVEVDEAGSQSMIFTMIGCRSSPPIGCVGLSQPRSRRSDGWPSMSETGHTSRHAGRIVGTVKVTL